MHDLVYAIAVRTRCGSVSFIDSPFIAAAVLAAGGRLVFGERLFDAR